jgi:hypothetical protein
LNAPERRLAALAAAFAAERAPALLARASGAGALAVAEEAARLASGPREGRLAALAASVPLDEGAARAAAEAAAALERPRVAAVLRALGSPSRAPRASAPLLRLCRERLGC